MYYGASRSQSAGPSSMMDNFGPAGGPGTTTTIPRRTAAEATAASHIASPITNRRFYQHQQPAYLRQHRSVDGMELIGNDLDQAYWNDFGMPQQQQQVLSQNCANDISVAQAYGTAVPPPKLSGSALEQEYELLKRDYEITLQKLHATMNSIKTFWSPELKRERQMRKEEAQKVLLLQQKIAMPYSQQGDLGADVEKLRMELSSKEQTINALMDMNRCDPNSLVVARRIADLESRCTHLDAALATKEEQLRAYQQKLSQVSTLGYEDTAKEARIVELEDELKRLKVGALNRPLDYTNKSISTHELHTLKMKMEKSEMELAHRSNELSSAQAKLRAAEESNGDFSRHVQLLKDSVMAKDQQISLLHEDVDALRKKLETKNQLIEHKDVSIKNLETMLENVRAQLADSSQTVKEGEQKMNQMNRRIDQLESTLREKENELEVAKQRLQAQPDVIFEKEMRTRLENAERDKIKLQQNIDEVRKNAEVERHEQLEVFKEQARKDRLQIESLQKELSDRQILLESQNEKIGDLDGELKRNIESGKMFKADVDKAKLHADLEEAHSEVERLLKIVQNLEKERNALTTKFTQLQSRTTPDVSVLTETPGTSSRGGSIMKNRIDELEEALRESVSITAEREMHVAQQKQINSQLSSQLNEALREISTLRKEMHDTSRSKDHEAINRAFEKERQKHLEQLLQLKHEAIVAALGEKDAHIALLEMSPREEVRDQLDTLRKHREKLMQKLKIENERRAKLMEQINASATSPYITPGSGVGVPTMDPGLSGAQNDQDDDAEGIWA